jgi:AcrR family transcriptional regulator
MNDSADQRSTGTRASAEGDDQARTRAGSDTRADLIAAGRKIFARKGFDGSSIRAITRLAGTNLGAVTYHFGSKRALYASVLEDGLRPIARRLDAAAASPGTARERTLRAVDAYFEHFEAHPDLPQLLIQEVAAGKEPPTVVIEILRGMKETVAGLQIEGAADGSVRPGHPVLLALSVVSQPINLTLIAPLLRTFAGFDLNDPEIRKMAVEHTKAFVCAGLAPTEEAP